MKTEQQLRDFLAQCKKVRSFGLSKGPCPMDPESEFGCCAECSTPAAIQWVLCETTDGSVNGQQLLGNTIAENMADLDGEDAVPKEQHDR